MEKVLALLTLCWMYAVECADATNVNSSPPQSQEARKQKDEAQKSNGNGGVLPDLEVPAPHSPSPVLSSQEDADAVPSSPFLQGDKPSPSVVDWQDDPVDGAPSPFQLDGWSSTPLLNEDALKYDPYAAPSSPFLLEETKSDSSGDEDPGDTSSSPFLHSDDDWESDSLSSVQSEPTSTVLGSLDGNDDSKSMSSSTILQEDPDEDYIPLYINADAFKNHEQDQNDEIKREALINPTRDNIEQLVATIESENNKKRI
ncbi:hypothetical protein FACS189449_02930 [Alphaproteobacteria bacterium]|nr:hypothetical protein FACS189449_02930 [Alphaproteobacteria bacterium]